MNITSLEVKYSSGPKELVHTYDFHDGVNVIISLDNNHGKTTLMRIISSLIFGSTSYELPLTNENLIACKLFVSNGENKYVSEAFLGGKGRVQTIVTRKNGIKIENSIFEECLLEDKVPFPKYTNGDSKEEIVIKNSWVIPYFSLDQDDTDFDSKKIKSFFERPYKVKKLVEGWLLGGYISNLEINSKIKNNIAELRAKIEINEELRSAITNNSMNIASNQDIEKFKILDIEFKTLLKDKMKIQNEIMNLSRKVNLLNKKIKGINLPDKDKSVWVDTMIDNEERQVKINISELLSYTLTEMKYYRISLEEQASSIEKERGIKFKRLQQINNWMEEINSKLPENYVTSAEATELYKAVSIVEKNIEKYHNELESEISKLNNNESSYKEAVNKMWTLFENWNKDASRRFSEFNNKGDTNSGADLMAQRVSKFLSLHNNKTIAKGMPIIIDSIRERDFADDRIKSTLISLKTMYDSKIISQAFVTFTNANGDLLDTKSITKNPPVLFKKLF